MADSSFQQMAVFARVVGAGSLSGAARELGLSPALVSRKLAALERSLSSAEDPVAVRQSAEAILANLAAIEPGQTELRFGDVQATLDPERTPLENAQRLFEEY